MPKPGTACLNWPAVSDPANPRRDGAWYLREIICCALAQAQWNTAQNAPALAQKWLDVVEAARCCLLNGQPPCTSGTHAHTNPKWDCPSLFNSVKRAWESACGQGRCPDPDYCLTELNHEQGDDKHVKPAGK